VIGHSWGGYSAFRLLADRPDVYKVGVSSAPGFDPFSSVLYEAYLGLPQTDHAAYQAAQTLTLAPKVQGRLMIVCGTSDHATWTDAIKMSEMLIRAGKDHEFVVMPEQYHGYDQAHDTYMLRKATNLFAEVLQA
jgi:dipeptidyl-peptidase 4